MLISVENKLEYFVFVFDLSCDVKVKYNKQLNKLNFNELY